MTGRLSFPKAAAIWTVLACITISDEGVADHQNVSVEPLAAYKKLEPSSVTVSGISSPTHPFWSDATTVPPNCSFGTYIRTPRPHP
jgi:hypothetical protein